jgi:DNA binding domain, excisionase family
MTKDENRAPLTDEMYTVAEVARYFKVTTAAVYKWMTLGKLTYIKVGNDRRVTRAAIEAFIKASTNAGVADGDTMDANIRMPMPAQVLTPAR